MLTARPRFWPDTPLEPTSLLKTLPPLLWLAAILCASPSNAQSNPLDIAFGDTGLTSLRYGGVDYLSNGDLSVQKVTLSGQNGDGGLTAIAARVDPRARKVTRTYPWGTVSCAYEAKGDTLSLTIGVHNTSQSTLTGISIQPLELRFPQAPRDWVQNYPYLGSNLGSPTVLYANVGTAALDLRDDDFDKPLVVGYLGRQSLQIRPVVVSSANFGLLPQQAESYLKRPILPGGFDVYHLSLRFGPSSAREQDLAGDLYRKFAAAYPQTLHWSDHRAIGTLHLAVSETKYHSASNPRGWFMDPNVDVVTDAGKAAFRKRVLDYADDSIKHLRDMDAQGMIVWDVEGEEYPQATTYIGDPRLVKALAPEMDAVADDFFKKFRDAGLRSGVCIRPQQLHHGADRTEQQEIDDPQRVTDLLYDKIAYAGKRWGCSLFYVDSNGDPNVPYDVAIFQRLTEKLAKNHIQALIMPEHQNTRYYAYTAPYDELRQNVTTTPELIRAVYPKAFTAIYAADGPLDADHDQLVQAVKRGDILLFRAWWDDPQNAQVKQIYRDAK